MMEGATAQIGASAGIALADTTNVSLDELTATADAALYDATRGLWHLLFSVAMDNISRRLIA